jgi:antitoxin component YwqK of YwqJK toxin-antitoxin module
MASVNKDSRDVSYYNYVNGYSSKVNGDDKYDLKCVREIFPTKDGGSIEVSSIYSDKNILICESNYKYLPGSSERVLNGKSYLRLSDIKNEIQPYSDNYFLLLLKGVIKLNELTNIYNPFIPGEFEYEEDAYLYVNYLNGKKNGEEKITVGDEIIHRANFVDGKLDGLFMDNIQNSSYIGNMIILIGKRPANISNIVALFDKGAENKVSESSKLVQLSFECNSEIISYNSTTQQDISDVSALFTIIAKIAGYIVKNQLLFPDIQGVITVKNDKGNISKIITNKVLTFYEYKNGDSISSSSMYTKELVIQYNSKGGIMRSGVLFQYSGMTLEDYKNITDTRRDTMTQEQWNEITNDRVIWDGTYDTKHFKGSIANGKFNGLYQIFYPNGKLKIQGSYDNGVKIGVFKEYMQTGGFLSTQYYINGSEVTRETYVKYIGEVLGQLEDIGIVGDVSGGVLAQYLH